MSKIVDDYFSKLASKVTLDSSDVAQLSELKDVTYAFRRYSWFEIRLWKEVCNRLGLPQGQVFYLRERIGYEVSVSRVKSFRVNTKNRLSRLLATDKVVVPISLFLGQGPKVTLRYAFDFNFLPAMDLVKAFYYYFSRSKLAFRLGPKIEANKQNSDTDFFRAISLALYKQEKVSRGVKNNTLAETIIEAEQVENQINSLSTQTGASRQQLQAEARKCFDEISASISPVSVSILYYALRKIMRTVFSKIQVNGIEQLRQSIKDHPTIVVPSHRSHFDYLLIGWIFLHADLPLPYVAAGSNLNFFPVGKILKSAGAFFIRRKSRGDLIYKTVLSVYLNYLIKAGHVIAFYIEGGRSRSGSMLVPKLGILKYIVKNWFDQGRRDISFVPISIAYEKVAEERALTRELVGEKKKSENIWQLLKLGAIWKKKFGEVVINISPAFTLTEFQNNLQTEEDKLKADISLFTEDLGYHLSRQVMSKTAITSTSLIALAAMSFDSYSINSDQLKQRVITYFDYITKDKADEKGFVSDYIKALQRKMSLAESVEVMMHNFSLATYQDNIFSLIPEKLVLVDYYKNNILHHFFPAAIVGFCFKGDNFNQSLLHAYQQIFKPFFLLKRWRYWSIEQQGLIELCKSKKDFSKDFKFLLLPFAEAYRNGIENPNEAFDDLVKAVSSEQIISNSKYRLESFSKTYLEFAFFLQRRINHIAETTNLSPEQVKDLMFKICS